MFPDYVPDFPPKREINFKIDLLPHTQTISIPPYRMTPVELMEFIEHVKDLLYKGQTQYLSVGCSNFYHEKKDGSLKMCIDSLVEQTHYNKCPIPTG